MWGHIYTKNQFIAYQKLKLNWAFSILSTSDNS